MRAIPPQSAEGTHRSDPGPRDSACDVLVVGGGIVGLATARALLTRLPGLRLTLLEKELWLGIHQTGHNSGVVHSGIYYRPGSLKAKLCVEGGRLLRAFCEEHRLPYQRVGKVIVATGVGGLPRLETLYERGRANGVPGLARLTVEQLREVEPAVRGMGALHLPDVAIVDFAAIARAYAQEVERLGGTILTSTRVDAIRQDGSLWAVHTPQGWHAAKFLVNCAGLHADRVARLAGDRAAIRIVPFRGEYYTLTDARRDLVRGLVYPVPHPATPFLGVHFTKMLDGGVHVGPNAVLALKREGYARTDVSLRDCAQLVTHPGFWRMAARYWRVGLDEAASSLSKRVFLHRARRLVPGLALADLQPAPAGVRAQAVGADGALLDDFALRESPTALHVYNAPSPAATASLAIAETIAGRLEPVLARLARRVTNAW